MNLETILSTLGINPPGASGTSVPRWLKGEVLELCLTSGWSSDSDAVIQWCKRANGQILESGETSDLATLADLRRNSRVIAWAPSPDTLLTDVNIPSRSKSKILRALPYALEDQLLDEPESQQYVYYRKSDSVLSVAVTNRDKLQNLIDRLTGFGLAPTMISPTNLSLPIADGSWTLMFNNTEMMIRTGQFSGFSIYGDSNTPPSTFVAAINDARDKKTEPTELLVLNAPESFSIDDWSDKLDLKISIDSRSLWELIDPANCSLNLMQGDFAPARESSPTVTRLRPAFILLSLWIATSASAGIWEWYQLEKTYDYSKKEMIRIFRQTFPGATIQDPVLQMQRNLDALRSGGGAFGEGDFLALLSQSAPIFEATSELTVRNLKYDNNGLVTSIGLADYQSMEALKNRLDTTGLSVEVLSANSQGSGVESRLRISAGTAK